MNMKKYRTLLLILVLACSLTACGSKTETGGASTSSVVSTSEETQDTAGESVETPAASQTEKAPGETDAQSGILIAYFTYGENASLPEGVDATTSASIQYRADGSVTGNTGLVADMIAESTGGDLFPILTAEKYPDSYDATIDAGQAEKNAGMLPELASHIENLRDYDTIFLGFPNWWYGMPMAVYSFLEEYDLSDMTIVPFVTSGGSGFSDAINEIERLEPNAEVLRGLALSGSRAAAAQDDVADWLAELGLVE